MNMKKRIKYCEKCGEDTRHSIKKVFSSKRRKQRREVDRCDECGKIIIKSAKTGTYTK